MTSHNLHVGVYDATRWYKIHVGIRDQNLVILEVIWAYLRGNSGQHLPTSTRQLDKPPTLQCRLLRPCSYYLKSTRITLFKTDLQNHILPRIDIRSHHCSPSNVPTTHQPFKNDPLVGSFVVLVCFGLIECNRHFEGGSSVHGAIHSGECYLLVTSCQQMAEFHAH